MPLWSRSPSVVWLSLGCVSPVKCCVQSVSGLAVSWLCVSTAVCSPSVVWLCLGCVSPLLCTVRQWSGCVLAVCLHCCVQSVSGLAVSWLCVSTAVYSPSAVWLCLGCVSTLLCTVRQLSGCVLAECLHCCVQSVSGLAVSWLCVSTAVYSPSVVWLCLGCVSPLLCTVRQWSGCVLAVCLHCCVRGDDGQVWAVLETETLSALEYKDKISGCFVCCCCCCCCCCFSSLFCFVLFVLF